MTPPDFDFRPQQYEKELVSIIESLQTVEELDRAALEKILARFPRDGSSFFSKSQIVRGIRSFAVTYGWDAERLIHRLRRKPSRTLSGVTPVAVLTRPHPCPGRCIFCPNDVRMPKSYLSLEPAAQRAERVRFDPYLQTWLRLKVFHNNGHSCEKIELIVLGGTWSSYPDAYRRWFVLRCLQAMNDFSLDSETLPERPVPQGIFDRNPHRSGAVRGALTSPVPEAGKTYNRIVSERLADRPGEEANWTALEAAQRENEATRSRCVGLSVETRPDEVTSAELRFNRRLGCTKIQIGYQSLSDEILERNRRGHDVESARQATALLRLAGFKIHAHWMPNLLGADPLSDRADFDRLFSDPGLRPDELKIYPCSLVSGTELMESYESGEWRPYEEEELVELISDCLRKVPEYCRVTRVIRDFSAADIVAGSRTSNLRQLVDHRMRERAWVSRDIRAREVRDRVAETSELELRETRIETTTGCEVFLQWVTREDRIGGFLRLALPDRKAPFEELEHCAVIREVHVYGAAADLGERSDQHTQHLGLGRTLIERATKLAAREGFARLAVISSIGTRQYYRRLGFTDGTLYQMLDVELANPEREAGGTTLRAVDISLR